MDDYTSAADVLKRAWQRRASVKTLCLGGSAPNKGKIYALVCGAVAHSAVLANILDSTHLLEREPRLSRPLATLLLHDLLFSKRRIRCGGWMKAAVMRHAIDLRAAAASQPSAETVLSAAPKLPRYVRVNTLLISLKAAVQAFTNDGSWTYAGLCCDPESESSGSTKGDSLRTFYSDADLPKSLLVFPLGTDLHEHPLYLSGQIILQDKASCFPAFILDPPLGAICVDTCAAPGNKTSHLAALLCNTGHITAFDRDAARLRTLETLVARAGCTNIQPVRADFTAFDTVIPPEATHVLVDPSCSGYALPGEKISRDRLHKLAAFQFEILLRATKSMRCSYFPHPTTALAVTMCEMPVN